MVKPARGTDELPLPASAWRQRFRRRLLAWYARHARDLPWRRSSDPYRVWVSEIMLQQTQVATVEPYFERFVKAYPTIERLAQADEQDVLLHWEGLGYYRRARQMHAAAQVLVDRHGGVFPKSREEVLALPGIGRYTAGAILSIAFDAAEPILEANTLRLFSRLLAFGGNPHSAGGQTLLWAMAEAVLPRHGAGRFNQALMELGSEVCRSRAPRCDVCPVVGLCEAQCRQLQNRLPRPKVKPIAQRRNEAAVIVRRRGRVLVVRGADGGRWAGLWDFPRFQVHAQDGVQRRRELVENVRRQTGVTIEPGRRLQTLKHGVTRFRITLDCYEALYVSGKPAKRTDDVRWLRKAELDVLPLNVTARTLSRLV